MNKLLIKQNKHNLYLMPWVWFLFTFCAFFHFLGNSFSQNAIILFLATFSLITAIHWAVFQASKREVLINKHENKVTIFSTKLFGNNIVKSHSINDFIGVRSYIHSGNASAPNILELVFADGNRGLWLSSFNHWPGDRFFKHDWHENKEVAKLRGSISKLTGLEDLGFIGNKYLGYSQVD